ncbi:MAG TPA: hypothetical protein VKA64_05880 [Gammaproteobacteria bacterium]|nr:hypothetical protein [Gammaproteobacteria bacterium]
MDTLSRITAALTAIVGLIGAIPILGAINQGVRFSVFWPLLVWTLVAMAFCASCVQLVGRTIRAEPFATRLLVVLSGIWTLVMAVVIDPFDSPRYLRGENNIADFVAVGLLPVAIIWGLVWVLRGIRGQRVDRNKS